MPKKVIPETPAEKTSPLSAQTEGAEPDLDVLGEGIDKRMKALLKDHQAMGARPKSEASNGDLYPNTYPLGEVGTDGRKTAKK